MWNPMDGPPTPPTMGPFLSISLCPALFLDGYYTEMNQWTDLRQGEEGCKGVVSHTTQALVWQVVR